MRYTVDDTLLAEAQKILRTGSAEETVAASLRETIRSRAEPMELPLYLSSDEDLERFRRALHHPRTPAELQRRREAVEAAGRLRVEIGPDPDFNVVDIIRDIRGGWAGDEPDGQTKPSAGSRFSSTA